MSSLARERMVAARPQQHRMRLSNRTFLKGRCAAGPLAIDFSEQSRRGQVDRGPTNQ
jgi:hypothetical protein